MTSLNFKSRVPVFDANVRVGDLLDEPAPYRDRAGLLAEMDRHGVERALIYHAHADNVSAIEGNNYLEAWLGDDGTHPSTVDGDSHSGFARAGSIASR